MLQPLDNIHNTKMTAVYIMIAVYMQFKLCLQEVVHVIVLH